MDNQMSLNFQVQAPRHPLFPT